MKFFGKGNRPNRASSGPPCLPTRSGAWFLLAAHVQVMTARNSVPLGPSDGESLCVGPIWTHCPMSGCRILKCSAGAAAEARTISVPLEWARA